MNHQFERRDFLKVAGLAAASSTGWGLHQVAASQDAPAAGRPRLLPGCCAYSYASYLKSGRMTMEQFILKGIELGVQGVDITTYWLKSTDAPYLASLRRFAYRNGMPLSGAAIGTNMCQADAAKRKEELEKIRKWVDATELLGASHLRVFGGELPAGSSDDQGIQWVVETMKPACEYAARKGVILGIESHGGITSKAANIVSILKQVDSPFAGCNLDIANFPENPYEQIEACLPYATHAHIRDFYGEAKKPLDLGRIWQLFVKAGYRGYMSAEYEGAEDSMTGVPKLIDKIKALCSKYSGL
ncbi:MAG: Xylose isomerase protein barrel [Acidobacteria bacterium]|nr:Xylose isomerase protein barrel [Acidobacteriota bacterium]